MNPSEQTDSGGEQSSEGQRIGGYGIGPIDFDPLEDDTLTYDGEPIQLSYYLEGTGSDTEVGLMLFLDGVPQPHQVIESSQQDGRIDADQEVLLSKHRVSSDGRIEFTVSFTPVTGSAGDDLGLFGVFLWEPSFVPETEDKGFGIYQDASFYIPLTVIMETDAPQYTENYAPAIETEPIPQSAKEISQNKDLDASGRVRQADFNLYTGEFNWSNVNLFAENGKIDLELSGYGGTETDYRVTIFVNHEPVSIAGQQSFLMGIHNDKMSKYKFTLDIHDYDRLNTIYAMIIPVGESYKDSEIYGHKTKSVLLVNDEAAVIALTANSDLSNNNAATAIAPAADKDLTNLLIENDLFSQYSTPGIHLTDDHNLLIWFDSAALFDLNSETLLYKTEISTDPYLAQKVDFAENIVGLFEQDLKCMTEHAMDCPLILDRYDASLNLINTVDVGQIFDIPYHVLDPHICALSKSGEKVACANIVTNQVLLYDLQTKEQQVVFDFSKSGLATFGYIDSLEFAGNDEYLAFTATESSGSGFGIIDLDNHNNKVIDYTKWDAIGEDIQTTDHAVFFHEEFKGPWYPSSGKIFKINLDTLEKQEIQLADDEESHYVTVSKNGKYIVTVRDTAEAGADYTAGSIKIYDGQTMELIRQINLERGFPRLVIDETNRSLIAYYYDGNMMKLVRYAF